MRNVLKQKRFLQLPFLRATSFPRGCVLRYTSASARKMNTQHDSAQGAVGTPEFAEKEKAQAAMAQQYARSQGTDVFSKSGANHDSDDKDDEPLSTSEEKGKNIQQAAEEKSRNSKKLGLHLPQAGFGPTDESINHAKAVRKESQSREGEATGMDLGVKELKDTKEYES